MEYTYEVIELRPDYSYIVRSDGASIPIDPANSDYQAYLTKDEPKTNLNV